LSEPTAFGPYRYVLTEEEKRLAAARLGLRYGLARRFDRDFVAPLVSFILLLVFVAILGFSSLVNRRLAEAALLVGAVLFLAARFLAHQRLRRAQRLAKATVEKIAAGGEIALRADEGGLALGDPTTVRASSVSFSELSEIEDAGGVCYVWRSAKQAPPLVIPRRIFANSAEAERFLAFVRARFGKG
jgi:hypothetical protein